MMSVPHICCSTLHHNVLEKSCWKITWKRCAYLLSLSHATSGFFQVFWYIYSWRTKGPEEIQGGKFCAKKTCLQWEKGDWKMSSNSRRGNPSTCQIIITIICMFEVYQVVLNKLWLTGDVPYASFSLNSTWFSILSKETNCLYHTNVAEEYHMIWFALQLV